MRIHCLLARLFVGLVTIGILAGNGLPSQADNWPQWRGPEGNGTSRETHLPIAWDANTSIVWQCPLPEWGNSTPAIWEDAIFLTTQVDNQKLLLLKINKKSGRIEWTRQVGEGDAPHLKMQKREGEQRRHQSFHDANNLASPSPVTDGQRVVVHFGNGDLAAYDFDGNPLWQRNLQKDYGDYTNWWGHANSPVLYENLVISICLQDSCADLPGELSPSYIVAHDARTGREQWKTMRMTGAKGEDGDSYVTPLLWKDGDRQELVVMGGQVLDAYDPAAGKRLWYLPELIGSRVISGPVATEGTIYVTQGMRKPLLAVRPGGDGKRPRQDVAWQFDQGTPDSPTPVVWGQSVFLVANDGVARCLDAASGRLLWKERLKGEYRASPLAADERIYFLNTKGLTTVIAASPRLNRLTENPLDDETFASPIVSEGRIFIRGRKALYCIGK
jgi:outer membrane protein assembly factor BamB